jgi:hypothetical protein
MTTSDLPDVGCPGCGQPLDPPLTRQAVEDASEEICNYVGTLMPGVRCKCTEPAHRALVAALVRLAVAPEAVTRHDR